MKKHKICVFGASGFIGRHLVMALHAQGHTLHIFSRSPCPDYLYANPNVHVFQGDFYTQKDVSHALAGCDICIHLLWTTIPAISNENIMQDANDNIIGSLQLLECAKQAGVSKFIFASSAGTVYGPSQEVCLTEEHPTHPICAYGVSKLCVEKYLDVYASLYGLDYACLRISNPYGPWQERNTQQGVIGVFLSKILKNEDIHIWGDGSVVRDFIYIDDVIQAFLLCLENSTSKLVLNIGSGKGVSLNELLVFMEKVSTKKAKTHYTHTRKCDVQRSVVCIDKAQKILRWQPKIDIHDGIQAMHAHLLTQLHT